jgi:hypothetical protein
MPPAGAADRSKLLEEMDVRHDLLLRELDDLNLRIEQALGQLRPSARDYLPSVTLKISRRDAEPQSSEED